MANIILRPTSDGSYGSSYTVYPTDPNTRFDKVNEETADDDTKYIATQTSKGAYTVTFNKDSISSGLPLKVTITTRIKKVTGGSSSVMHEALLYIGGDIYTLPGSLDVGTGYENISKTWTLNPVTNQPWTLAEVHNLQFGSRVYIEEEGAAARITQTYLTLEMADGVVKIDESGAGVDSLDINASISILDGGTNQQDAGVGGVYDPKYEHAVVSKDFPISDSGQGSESKIALQSNSVISDLGSGMDISSNAKSYYFITTDNVLNPLGVIVLRDSKESLLPPTREYSETIPGCHGEIDFGSEFQPRVLELKVAKSIRTEEREQLKRTLVKWLNPTLGPQSLVYENDIEKTYYVKYAGKIDISQWTDYMEFVIPFKASNPFIMGSFEKTQVGSGVIVNEGNIETPVAITIYGPVTNPSLVIGGDIISYTGALAEGDIIIIDTQTMTVKFNDVNAIANYIGNFPKLQPGETSVIAPEHGTTILTWRDRWI